MRVGEVLKEARIKQKLRQGDVALRLEVTTGMVSKIERGKCLPGIELAMKIAAKFSIPFPEFWEEIKRERNETRLGEIISSSARKSPWIDEKEQVAYKNLNTAYTVPALRPLVYDFLQHAANLAKRLNEANEKQEG